MRGAWLRWLCLTIAVFCVLAPLDTFAAEATPVPESAESLSAQRAASERGKIYEGGLAYTRWLDGIAQRTGNEFLQRVVLDRITWMRLLACVGSLAVIALLTSFFLRFVRQRAGAIESNEHQSWLALAAAAIRKPPALLIWVIGGFLAFMPIVTGISSRPSRLFLANSLTAMLYAGRVIAVLWLIFQGIRAIEKRMRHWAQKSGSVLNNVIVLVAGQTLRLAVDRADHLFHREIVPKLEPAIGRDFGHDLSLPRLPGAIRRAA
ncbi:MAG: hypothetical protein H0W66_07730 [Chthoniobacterales bacterium]|nr:hypothetical protein [Chthoniobacterales bacterium]